MSLRQACRTLSLSRTVYFYRPDTRRDEPVIHALTELAERYPRYGFKKLFQLLRQPYVPQPDLERESDLAPLPGDQPEVAVSCSS